MIPCKIRNPILSYLIYRKVKQVRSSKLYLREHVTHRRCLFDYLIRVVQVFYGKLVFRLCHIPNINGLDHISCLITWKVDELDTVNVGLLQVVG